MRTSPIARGFFLGDYEGLAHVDQASLPFFVITNSGNLTNRTDVFAAVPRAGEDVPGEQGSNVQEQVNTAARSSQALAASHRASRRGDTRQAC
ncbi:MAG: hypothetical protein E6I52_19255 [Chloroflexi bacterium]|nr:MAG: hypothetical protein E6I52_19255 [Chloroflexota bacterium]